MDVGRYLVEAHLKEGRWGSNPRLRDYERCAIRTLSLMRPTSVIGSLKKSRKQRVRTLRPRIGVAME